MDGMDCSARFATAVSTDAGICRRQSVGKEIPSSELWYVLRVDTMHVYRAFTCQTCAKAGLASYRQIMYHTIHPAAMGANSGQCILLRCRTVGDTAGSPHAAGRRRSWCQFSPRPAELPGGRSSGGLSVGPGARKADSPRSTAPGVADDLI